MFEKLPLRALADAGDTLAQVVMRGLACQESPHGQRPLSIRDMVIYDDMISKSKKTLKDIGIPNEPAIVEWILKIRNEWDEIWKAGVSRWYKESSVIRGDADLNTFEEATGVVSEGETPSHIMPETPMYVTDLVTGNKIEIFQKDQKQVNLVYFGRDIENLKTKFSQLKSLFSDSDP